MNETTEAEAGGTGRKRTIQGQYLRWGGGIGAGVILLYAAWVGSFAFAVLAIVVAGTATGMAISRERTGTEETDQ